MQSGRLKRSKLHRSGAGLAEHFRDHFRVPAALFAHFPVGSIEEIFHDFGQRRNRARINFTPINGGHPGRAWLLLFVERPDPAAHQPSVLTRSHATMKGWSPMN
jgi:hypothetical protein